VWAAHAVLALVFAATYSFGTFFPAFETAFNASRASVAFAFSLSVFAYFIIGIPAGLLADRTHVRVTAVTGVVLAAAGFWWAARAQSLMELYAALLLGIGFGVGFAYVPTIGAVQPWFVKKRGLAAGLASAGIGLGTLVGPLFAAWAISDMGFRGALNAMAWVVLVGGLAAAVWLEKDPARRGLAADNGPVTPSQGATGGSAAVGSPAGGGTIGGSVTNGGATSGVSFAEGVRSKPFRIMFQAQFACSLMLFMPMAHLPRHALDRGFSAEAGAWLLGLVGVGSFCGRFFLTGVGDKVGKRRLSSLAYAGLGAGFAWWAICLALPPSLPALMLVALAYGISYGTLVGIAPPLLMDYTGGKNLSGLLGTLYAGAGIGTLFAPTFAGYMHDTVGSYAVPVLMGVALNAFAAWWCLRLPEVGR
jgi:MFS transporter, OFA family, oxalate/formate antiporter